MSVLHGITQAHHKHPRPYAEYQDSGASHLFAKIQLIRASEKWYRANGGGIPDGFELGRPMNVGGCANAGAKSHDKTGPKFGEA